MSDKIHYLKSEKIGEHITKTFTRYPSGVVPVAAKYFDLSTQAFFDLADILREGAKPLIDHYRDETDPSGAELGVDFPATQELLFEVRVFYLALLGGSLRENGEDKTSIEEKLRFMLQLATEEYFGGEGPIEGTPAFDSTFETGMARFSEYIKRKDFGNRLRWYYQVLLTAQEGKLFAENDPLIITGGLKMFAVCTAIKEQAARFLRDFAVP